MPLGIVLAQFLRVRRVFGWSVCVRVLVRVCVCVRLCVRVCVRVRVEQGGSSEPHVVAALAVLVFCMDGILAPPR